MIFANQEQGTEAPKVIIKSLEAIRGLTQADDSLTNIEIYNSIQNYKDPKISKLITHLKEKSNEIYEKIQDRQNEDPLARALRNLEEVNKIEDLDYKYISDISFLCKELRKHKQKIEKCNILEEIYELDNLVHSFFLEKGNPLIIGIPGIGMTTEDDQIQFERLLQTIYPQFKSPIFVSASPDISNGLLPDLGQKNCQACLKKSIIPLINKLTCKQLEVIFHGWSQGTATILNYLAKLPYNKHL